MGRAYLRLVMVAVTGSLVAPIVTIVASYTIRDGVLPWLDLPVYGAIATAIVVGGLLAYGFLRSWKRVLAAAAAAQSDFHLQKLPYPLVGLSIAVSAGVSL